MPEQPEILFLVPSRSEGDQALRVEAPSRGDGDVAHVTVAAQPGRDVVRLELVNGPELILHPENVRDLLMSQKRAPQRSGGTDEKGVRVPARLEWQGSDKLVRARGSGGGSGQVVLHAFQVIKRTVSSQGANLLVPAAASWVDGLETPGLRKLTADGPDGPAVDLTGPATDAPILVMVHGTLSNTAGSFKRLWLDNPDLVHALMARFPGGIYGFEHPTLRMSPIDNALALAQALPKKARVHFLTHSRGGLVVEALAQAAGRQLDQSELEPFDQVSGNPDLREIYARQKASLQALNQLARSRELHVDRVVRVACPARGTLLASKRLDAYLSVLKWGLQLAQVPVAPQVVDLLLAVAKEIPRPESLAGLEAMVPDSPFMRWLHHPQKLREIPGQLRVVAGDLQGDSIGSWVKTLLADAFYWTDNDLIVQTRSMYGGGPRTGGDSTFFFDRGGKVTHFNYFSNRQTADAVVRALCDDKPTGFATIGPDSSKGLSSTGIRGQAVRPVERSRAKHRPAVIVLPGILGTHLRVEGKRIWLSPYIVNGLHHLAYRDDDGVQPDGPLGRYYDNLMEHLAASHEVIPCDYDWRRPIPEQARLLAEKVQRALDDRKDNDQPVRLIAHSMGGLVARAMALEFPELWKSMMDRSGARLVMLGTPHGGSWAPMQVLSGDNLVGGLVTAVGTLFDEVRARQIFAGLPGFLQLQAGLLDNGAELSSKNTWLKLAKLDQLVWHVDLPWHKLKIQKQVADWGIPEQAILEQAKVLHQRLRDQDLGPWAQQMVLVVGCAGTTPAGYEIGADGGFDYLQTEDGDGTVTLANGLLPELRTYQVQCEHASLPRDGDLHPGYLDLLERGSTAQQAFKPLGAARGAPVPMAAPRFRRMPRMARLRGWTPEALQEVEGTLSLPSDAPAAEASAAIPTVRVSVVNGDLTFVKQPLLLGHYHSLALTGAEGVMDRFLKGTMSEALRLRRYPTVTGESDVFQNLQPNRQNPLAVPRPAAVVVVGLGPEGELRAEELARTVRQGVIGYAQRLAEDPGGTSSFELASTFVASGGMGVSVGTSARAVIRGVRAANEKLVKEGWPIVSHLRFVELYEDRATEALRELVATADRLPAAFQVDEVLETGHRPLPQPETPGYRGANYDYVSALKGPREDGKATIAFTVDTKRARTEVRSSSTQLGLLQGLIKEAESDRRSDGKLGKSLFRVLVPAELDSFFGDSEAVVLEVDDSTAPLPWEILGVDHDDDQPSDRPWAIRTKLLRKLRSKRFLENPIPAGIQADVLVFGDPKCDRQMYPELDGARREAKAVAKVLGLDAPLVEASAREIVAALLERAYSVVHIAGHGKEDGSGVVMSDGQVLGAELVRCMRRVPDLVFVNCCHSARQTLGPGKDAGGRPARAATIASALIRIGVRCVIATGWAVDDDAAERFAQVFYEQLLARESFIDATSRARDVIWREFRGSNTWAAYQCYGDPDWRMIPLGDRREVAPARPAAAGATRPSVTPSKPLIASPSALLIALRSVSWRADTDPADALLRLENLGRTHGPRFGHLGDVAEAFAVAHADLGKRDGAIHWYERAAEAEKGDASYRSLEQLCNLRARRAAEQVAAAHARWTADRNAAAFEATVTEARREIAGADRELRALTALRETYERLNLIASACKRAAMVERAVHLVHGSRAARWKDALEKTVEAFRAAENRARLQRRDDLYYSLLNRMTADLVLRLSEQGYAADPKDVAEVKASLKRHEDREPDFWVLVSEPELEIYQALCARQLEAALPRIKQKFEQLRERIDRTKEWASVRDQSRFTLEPYGEVVGQEEQAASGELTQLLESFAAEPQA